ncbi:dihydrolipoamide dehydrogenase [Polynucleobacter meluiroseus]|uniref:Dihydrolipoyl dehydrogenase n=1 Tax=Polynucleobacter meluiroseus TaxID=1938814 RepID=A0A240E0D7_9BURK|nr:dihydrolipoyl dehydrogenase [Polynucleobacter meluiroseus]SNX28677.1 dihydrolipoamide dehydrogenase [Polynucleobacter meluiroseus]
MTTLFDVLVIGGGPGGYIAAIRAAQLGFKVACAESKSYDDPKGEIRLGGTCLNVGCIPSKALLASSEEFEKISHHAADHGIKVGSVSLDSKKMIGRKDDIVTKMTGGIQYLFRKNKITLLKGHASFVGKTAEGYQVKIDGKDQEIVTATNVIIATGSKARHLPGVVVDNVLVCDNEGALKFDSVPKKLGVIGAGVIGLELGSVWRRVGSEVTILEAMPSFLGACDQGIAKEAQKLFAKQGLAIHTGVKIGEIKTDKKGVVVHYTDSAGAAQKLECERLIVSIGRVPNTDQLALDAIGLKVDERGFIPIDDHTCATAAPGVYAVGDVVRGPMLAHKAEDEGVLVAEIIAGQKPHIDYNCIPWVIYTDPEIAWVGRSEEQLKAAGIEYKAGQFPFAANGRALGIGKSDGFVKVLADAKTDEILGVHIIGPNASDLIAEAAVAMEFKAAAEDIARICHPHPSLSEVVREAALATDSRALNM